MKLAYCDALHHTRQVFCPTLMGLDPRTGASAWSSTSALDPGGSVRPPFGRSGMVQAGVRPRTLWGHGWTEMPVFEPPRRPCSSLPGRHPPTRPARRQQRRAGGYRIAIAYADRDDIVIPSRPFQGGLFAEDFLCDSIAQLPERECGHVSHHRSRTRPRPGGSALGEDDGVGLAIRRASPPRPANVAVSRTRQRHGGWSLFGARSPPEETKMAIASLDKRQMLRSTHPFLGALRSNKPHPAVECLHRHRGPMTQPMSLARTADDGTRPNQGGGQSALFDSQPSQRPRRPLRVSGSRKDPVHRSPSVNTFPVAGLPPAS